MKQKRSDGRAWGMLGIVLVLWIGLGAEAHGQGAEFIRRLGDRLVRGSSNEVIYLRGAQFQNDLMLTTNGDWTRDVTIDNLTPITNWYSTTHVARAESIGFNSAWIQLWMATSTTHCTMILPR